MLYVYLCFGLILLAAAIAVYRVVARWGRGRGVMAALVALLVGVAVWPLPIHGGFMLLGEVWVDELRSSLQQQAERRDTRRHDAFIEGQARRFAARLDFVAGGEVESGWRSGTTPEGSPVWLDEASGLVWSEVLPFAVTDPTESLRAASQACADHPPRGQWALPTDAEGYFAWRNGGQQVLPRRSGRFVSQRVDTTFELTLPVVAIVRPRDARPAGQESGELAWRVRCVALGEKAPRRGYLDLDISRNDWNTYQLDKLR